MSVLCDTFETVFPVWSSTKTQHNGLGWDSTIIGIVMAIAGVTSIASMAFYPYIVAKLGILRCYQVACVLLLLIGLVFPFNSDLAKIAPTVCCCMRN